MGYPCLNDGKVAWNMFNEEIEKNLLEEALQRFADERKIEVETIFSIIDLFAGEEQLGRWIKYKLVRSLLRSFLSMWHPIFSLDES